MWLGSTLYVVVIFILGSFLSDQEAGTLDCEECILARDTILHEVGGGILFGHEAEKCEGTVKKGIDGVHGGTTGGREVC